MAGRLSAAEAMVERQIVRRGVSDARVLAAMRKVPREAFVAREMVEFAHEDMPLPIACAQTISQPYIVAAMAEAARIKPTDRVLDVGTGSGYGAAVLGELGGQVVSVERHAELADAARERLERLAVANVEIHTGDGTKGWPPNAPYDAIVVAAAPAEVPEALKQQLATGGRLVIPVGGGRHQRLLRVTRTAAEAFDVEDLGAVAFVPLIEDDVREGEPGDDPPAERKPGEATDPPAAPAPEDAASDDVDGAAMQSAAERPERDIDAPRDDGAAVGERGARPCGSPPAGSLAALAEPLPDIEDEAFAAAFDRFAACRVVLLGEASHGTSEFYRARTAITRRLVERHGFTIVAAEADWPDARSVHRAILGRPDEDGQEPPFARFPSWMWRNEEATELWRALYEHNARGGSDPVGFYGLDLYNLNASLRAVLDYLDAQDPEAARVARARYSCIFPWRAAPAQYGRMASTEGYRACEAAVTAVLTDMVSRRSQTGADDDLFDATQSARLVANAESYYRAMYRASHESWNLRDSHMFETLRALLNVRPGAKAVVWAHNSHIGDARATEMGKVRGEHNLGQLCREAFAQEAALVGFGTHTGTVAAADDWDGPMRVMDVVPSRADSWEGESHALAIPRFLAPMQAAGEALRRPRLERFIGVIYRPDTEIWSHYAEAQLAEQFDAWVWLDETRAIAPLDDASGGAPRQTFPFAV